jgi:hypothetical protein
MVAVLIPLRSADARGRYGRSGGVKGSGSRYKGRRRTAGNAQKLQLRGRNEMKASMLRRRRSDRQG